jgi:hypothetical protein
VVHFDSTIRENLREAISISRKNLQAIKNWKQYQEKIESVIKNMTDKQLGTAYINLWKLSNHKTIKNNKEFFAYFWDLVVYEIFLRTWENIKLASNTLSSAKTNTTEKATTTEVNTANNLANLSKSLILSKYALQNTENWKKLQVKFDIVVRNMSFEELEKVYNNLSSVDVWYKEATNYYRDLVSYEFHLESSSK